MGDELVVLMPQPVCGRVCVVCERKEAKRVLKRG